MTAIKVRGETPFPEAGKGVVLRFRNSDLKRVEAELAHDWFQLLIDDCMKGNLSLTWIEILVEHGAKKDGEPYVVPEEVMDDIPVHIMGERLFDAVCISMKGKNAKEFLEETFAAMTKAQEDGIPSRLGPATTISMTSVDSVSGQGSDSTNSGTMPPAKRSNTLKNKSAHS